MNLPKNTKKNINSVVFIVAWLKDMFQSRSDFEDSVMSTLTYDEFVLFMLNVINKWPFQWEEFSW